MKIMHLTYDMRIGGTEMVIKNIVEGLMSDEIQMTIFCIESPIGPWGKGLAEQGVPVTCSARKPGFDRALIRKIRAYIKSHHIEVIHCHQYTPWVYGVLAALGLKTRVIFTEHGRFYPDVSSWKRRLINPFLCRITDKITAISEATRQALAEYENIPAKRIETLYNGIKPVPRDGEASQLLRKALGLTSEQIVLGTVARMDPIKNHPMMLRAFAQVKAKFPEAVLIIVGDGDERIKLEQQIVHLQLEQSVILTGYQPTPYNYIDLMDIFLLSSLSEGTSMTLLEAMSLSKPCVVTDAGGNKEIIKQGVNGIVTPNDDADAFAKAVLSLLDEPSRREKFGQNALGRFQEFFTESHMNACYKNIYTQGQQEEVRSI